MLVKKMYDNNEISGKIYCQLCNLFIEALLQEDKDFFMGYSLNIMHKLNAIKYHLNNYKKIEEIQYQKTKQLLKKGKINQDEQLELIFELEAFLFQIKSSLDMLTKLLIPIIGRNMIHTQTYGDKGDKLIKGLEQYKKKTGVNIEAVDNLITLMKDAKDSWLENVISARDKLNHLEGLRNYNFNHRTLINGQLVVEKPKFDDMNTVHYMELVYSNNLDFHQDFIVLALAIKTPSCFCIIPKDPKEAIQEYGELGKYIKYAWGMKNSAIPGDAINSL
ncbi:MAG TPA: hypothetical protein VFD03_00535 [Clostridia bacterium]|nr:hypothetical protein [Clostridia bacterium]